MLQLIQQKACGLLDDMDSRCFASENPATCVSIPSRLWFTGHLPWTYQIGVQESNFSQDPEVNSVTMML